MFPFVLQIECHLCLFWQTFVVGDSFWTVHLPTLLPVEVVHYQVDSDVCKQEQEVLHVGRLSWWPFSSGDWVFFQVQGAFSLWHQTVIKIQNNKFVNLEQFLKKKKK